VLHISIWGLEALFGWAKPTKSRCAGNGTGYQQASISKTVLPNHTRWDIRLFTAQKRLQHLTFDSNCVEQICSVHPLL